MASKTVLTMLSSRALLLARPVARRSLHASSSVSRKKPAASEQHEDEGFNQVEEEDLFAVSEEQPVTSTPGVANLQRRQDAVAEIKNYLVLSRTERKSAPLPTRLLATVVHSTTTKEEAEELKDVLRSWRVAGLRVTDKMADTVIGRCCNVRAPEVAVELVSDRVQYGLPSPTNLQLARLHRSLLEHNPTAPLPALTNATASPSLILLRLALLAEESKGSVSDVTKFEVERLVALTERWFGKSSGAEIKWAASAREKLVGLGSEWKAAAESLKI